jgi:hypothetical protein
MKKLTCALFAATFLAGISLAKAADLGASAPVEAGQKASFGMGGQTKFIIRLRGIAVVPDVSSRVTGLPAGTKAEVEASIMRSAPIPGSTLAMSGFCPRICCCNIISTRMAAYAPMLVRAWAI